MKGCLLAVLLALKLQGLIRTGKLSVEDFNVPATHR